MTRLSIQKLRNGDRSFAKKNWLIALLIYYFAESANGRYHTQHQVTLQRSAKSRKCRFGHRPVTRAKMNQIQRDFTKLNIRNIRSPSKSTFICLQSRPFSFSFLHLPDKWISPMACKRSGVRFPLAPPIL